jgi:hypothetical protein
MKVLNNKPSFCKLVSRIGKNPTHLDNHLSKRQVVKKSLDNLCLNNWMTNCRPVVKARSNFLKHHLFAAA